MIVRSVLYHCVKLYTEITMHIDISPVVMCMYSITPWQHTFGFVTVIAVMLCTGVVKLRLPH